MFSSDFNIQVENKFDNMKFKNIQTFEQHSSELNISNVIHSNSYLSKSDIDFLESKGFTKDISKRQYGSSF